MIPEPITETEKVTYVVNGLKDVALTNDVPMVSIVAGIDVYSRCARKAGATSLHPRARRQ